MDYPLQAAQRVSLTVRIAQHLSTHHTDPPCRADPVHPMHTMSFFTLGSHLKEVFHSLDPAPLFCVKVLRNIVVRNTVCIVHMDSHWQG